MRSSRRITTCLRACGQPWFSGRPFCTGSCPAGRDAVPVRSRVSSSASALARAQRVAREAAGDRALHAGSRSRGRDLRLRQQRGMRSVLGLSPRRAPGDVPTSSDAGSGPGLGRLHQAARIADATTPVPTGAPRPSSRRVPAATSKARADVAQAVPRPPFAAGTAARPRAATLCSSSCRTARDRGENHRPPGAAAQLVSQLRRFRRRGGGIAGRRCRSAPGSAGRAAATSVSRPGDRRR